MPKTTARTRVRRHPERGSYDREAVAAILDEGLHCHLGFVHDGQPYVIPTLHARVGDTVYVHRSTPSPILPTLPPRAPPPRPPAAAPPRRRHRLPPRPHGEPHGPHAR